MGKRKQRGGRAPGTGAAPLAVRDSKLVQARVPAALYDRIQKAADSEMIGISAYVRRTLQNTVPGG